jgi:ribosomal protein S18 acetylase RimI-like enzyme
VINKISTGMEGFTIRLSKSANDKQQLESLGLPRRYIRQYTNSLPVYYVLKVLGICVNYLFLLIDSKSGAIVGTVLLRKKFVPLSGYSWKIHAVYVAPELRGKGLGAALVQHALDVLAGAHVKVVSLKVDDDNEPALRLYKKLGFVQTGCQRGQRVLSKKISGDNVPRKSSGPRQVEAVKDAGNRIPEK